MIRVLYTAAHGGFAGQPVPLGGGAAIAERLMTEWSRARPFEVRLIDPSVLGAAAPSARDLVTFDEARYARFCHDFSKAATAEILREDPRRTVVLGNDISEGPDAAALARAGFRVSTIFHVDVAAYIAAIYLKGLARPETLVRWQARLPRRLSPPILDLIFRKQREVVEHGRRSIVPSEGMRDVIGRCYGAAAAAKVEVVPWGVTPSEPAPGAGAELRREFGVPADAPVLLTLSRISPEKGQDLLLDALRGWRGPELWLFVCGEPAFMRGEAFARLLRTKAERLRGVRTVFPGYVMGPRKRAFFDMASVYVFPSRHESYGLTLLEALQAGLPSVCLDHHGSRAAMRPEFGEIVQPGGLLPAIERLLASPERRGAMGLAAAEWASTQRFADAAARIATLLASDLV